MRRLSVILLALTCAGGTATNGMTDAVAPGVALVPDEALGAEALGAEADRAHAELGRIRAECEEARTQVGALQQRLEESEGRIASLAESLAAARTEADLFRRKWEGSAVDRALLGDWITGDEGAIRDRFEAVCRDLLASREQRDGLAERLNALLDALGDGARDPAVRTEMAASRAALVDASRGDRRAAMPEPPVEVPGCRVLSVNPDLNVVVLTVGGTHGVQPGMEMQILRAEEPVARVRVVETRDSVCAAVIQKVADSGGPRVGDLARMTRSGS